MRPVTNDFIIGKENSFAETHAPEPPSFDVSRATKDRYMICAWTLAVSLHNQLLICKNYYIMLINQIIFNASVVSRHFFVLLLRI